MCIEDVPHDIRGYQLPTEDLEYMLEICEGHYSSFLTHLLKNLVKDEPQDRWGLEKIKNYLQSIQMGEVDETTFGN